MKKKADPFAIRAQLIARKFRNGGLSVRDARTLARVEQQCHKTLAPIFAADMRALRRIEKRLMSLRYAEAAE